jgi:hypothetical protein
MSMTSRERLAATLKHQQPDRVCVDFGGTAVTGIHVSIVSALRRRLLGDETYRVKVVEPYQMLGEIDDALRDALGIDVVGSWAPKGMFGFANTDWKPFTLFDGTDVLVPGGFEVTVDENQGLLIYPEGDRSAGACARMPHGGYFFDAISRQRPVDDDALDPADNLEEFSPLADADLQHFARQAERGAALNKGVIVIAPGVAFGDIALVPALWKKDPHGIRDVEEWYVSTAARQDYVYKVFEGQCAIGLQNLERLSAAVGDNAQAAFVTGTDFGTQAGLFISRKAYRELYMPFHKIINGYIHAHTSWKTFIHSCGCVTDLIPDFIEAGFDILNPVQTSAAGMDPVWLKNTYGKDIVFWGGGVDTQKTLPYGTPEDVYREVRERVQLFNKDGGFVFNSVHNIQALVPVENVEAMFRALKEG